MTTGNVQVSYRKPGQPGDRYFDQYFKISETRVAPTWKHGYRASVELCDGDGGQYDDTTYGNFLQQYMTSLSNDNFLITGSLISSLHGESPGGRTLSYILRDVERTP